MASMCRVRSAATSGSLAARVPACSKEYSPRKGHFLKIRIPGRGPVTSWPAECWHDPGGGGALTQDCGAGEGVNVRMGEPVRTLWSGDRGTPLWHAARAISGRAVQSRMPPRLRVAVPGGQRQVLAV
jgi:hypothetical protein